MTNSCGFCFIDYTQEQVKNGQVLQLSAGGEAFCSFPCWEIWTDKKFLSREVFDLKLLSWRERAILKILDFFKNRPAAAIMAIGAPLLAINSAAVAAGIGLVAVLGKGSTILSRIDRAWTSAIAAALAVTSGTLLTEAQEFGLVPTLAGATLAGVAAVSAVKLPLRAKPAPLSNFLLAEAAVAGLVGASVLMNGGGMFLAKALSSLST